ncbi:MAG TPA: hypothetical protein VFS66_05080 [Acidimicrobiia bacterium]|nr:hypothetical protein [Acidimicrobiia bacterium]
MTRVGKLLTVGLVLSACTGGSADPTTTSTEVASTAAETSDSRLLVIDETGDVVVMNADGDERVTVAEAGDDGPQFGQPIWSPDGAWVSFARASQSGFGYVAHQLDSGASIETEVDQFPFYASWSPGGDHVGLLRNGQTDVTFEMLDVVSGALRLVDDGTPYYFSWSPVGSDLVAHSGPDRLVTIGVDGVVVDEVETSSSYLAPTWLAEGFVHVSGDELVVRAQDGSVRPVAVVAETTTFVVSPTGSRVAAQTFSSNPAISVALAEVPTLVPNTISVVDLADGSTTVAWEGIAIAYFWSPDGQRLLILSLDESGSSVRASVWSSEGVNDYGNFVPHPTQLRDVYPFFPQYAQSMSYWSPDSSSFVLVGAIEDEVGVWVQRVGEAEPVLVSAGSWAVWSP